MLTAMHAASHQAVQGFLSGSGDVLRCRRAMGAAIAAFDPEAATSPRGVFCLVDVLPAPVP